MRGSFELVSEAQSGRLHTLDSFYHIRAYENYCPQAIAQDGLTLSCFADNCSPLREVRGRFYAFKVSFRLHLRRFNLHSAEHKLIISVCFISHFREVTMQSTDQISCMKADLLHLQRIGLLSLVKAFPTSRGSPV